MTATLPQLLAAGRITLTLAETAGILGVHSQTVSAAAARGEILSVTYGRRVLVLALPLAEQLGVPVPGPQDPAPQDERRLRLVDNGDTA